MSFAQQTILLLSLMLTISACHRSTNWHNATPSPFMQQADLTYIDSLILHMNLEEKVGQLICLKINDQAAYKEERLYQMVKAGHIGNLILQNYNVESYTRIINNCQAISKLPLLNGTTELVSLSNQFQDAPKFPTAATISALSDDATQMQLLQLYIQQCKALGINFSIAPNTQTPLNKNQSYNYQTYEHETEALLQRAIVTTKHLQAHNILAIANAYGEAQYFPNDSLGIHHDELSLQRALSDNGLSGWMVNNDIYKIDTLDRLFPNFLQDYLYDRFGFGGLLISEITENASVGKLLHAGSDIFVTEDAHAVFETLKSYVTEGIITEDALNKKVQKVLLAKKWIHKDLKQNPSINPKWASKNVLYPDYDYFIEHLYQSSCILANNYKEILPFKRTYKRNFRVFQYGEKPLFSFQKYFNKYASFANKTYEIDAGSSFPIEDLVKKSKATNIITISDIDLQTLAHHDFVQKVNELSQQSKVVLINFGNPYNLALLDTTITTIQIFENNKTTQQQAAQLLFGAAPTTGRLPLDIADHLPYNLSNPLRLSRLQYDQAQAVGIAPEKLVEIDAIVQTAIKEKVMPGCQILVAKSGKVIYNKGFGYHTYSKKRAVSTSDIYDIASITKIASTTLAAMKLYEKGTFQLTDNIAKHLTLNDSSELKDINLYRLFIHESNLQPNMPIAPYVFSKKAKNRECSKYYCNEKQEDYSIQIAKNMFLQNQWVDSIWTNVYDIEPYDTRKYRYSDVNFNLIQKLIETKSQKSLDEFVNTHFYKPLNLRNCGYQPIKKHALNKIVPTAIDNKWRKQLVHGYVHDESAALLGGVAGNAGLFSNAEDLATLFQMLLNGGRYGDKQYLQPKIIKLFTSKQDGTHRGLGFDRASKSDRSSTSEEASYLTFGHTGFTGTSVWVDPKEELIFVFLSNRIHPSIKNRKLFKQGIRKRVHSVVYNAIDSYKFSLPTNGNFSRQVKQQNN